METLHEGKFRKLGITVEQVIGSTGGKETGMPETCYLFITLDDIAQKFLAVTEEGSDNIILIEAKDNEEALEFMIDHIAEKLEASSATMV